MDYQARIDALQLEIARLEQCERNEILIEESESPDAMRDALHDRECDNPYAIRLAIASANAYCDTVTVYGNEY